VYFVLQQTLADLGSVYLIILGAIAILVMLKAPGGLWSLVPARWSRLVFPVQLQVRTVDAKYDPPRLRTLL
jgi:branched-chain amino acid transport system permease protein